jgi:hypothetical protein
LERQRAARAGASQKKLERTKPRVFAVDDKIHIHGWDVQENAEEASQVCMHYIVAAAYSSFVAKRYLLSAILPNVNCVLQACEKLRKKRKRSKQASDLNACFCTGSPCHISLV